jgi:hypothetical protein
MIIDALDGFSTDAVTSPVTDASVQTNQYVRSFR